MNEQIDMQLEPPAATYPVGVPPDVCIVFERLALKVAEAGFKRYSADAILHRIRWTEHVERGNRGFKANNNWTAPLARWFLKRNPQHAGFFELRERTDEVGTDD